MEAFALQFNPSDPAAWQERLVHGSAPEAERLAAATREFEAVLLRQYLKSALKPITKGVAGLSGNNAVYGYLINDALATSLARGGVFGFSHLLQAQLAAGTQTNDDHTHDDF